MQLITTKQRIERERTGKKQNKHPRYPKENTRDRKNDPEYRYKNILIRSRKTPEDKK
jgi:hypothetical protein